MNTLIAIPAYNTQKELNILIYKLSELTDLDILVYDDGSDIPIKILSQPKNAIKLLRNDRNKGKGNVLKKAFKYAGKNNYTHMITIDSDLQHDPVTIDKFKNSSADTDLVIGKRSFGSPMPLHRRLSNKITSGIISFMIKNKIYDSQSGYRRYKLSLLRDTNFNEEGFHFESEILLKCIDSKTKIEHIDISTIYNSSISSIKNFSDTVKFVLLIGRNCFGR